MKTLTREEFESLVKTKTPVTELPDGSDIELTSNQAIAWFEKASSYSEPSFVLEVGRWVFLGERSETAKETNMLHQIGGTK